MTFHRGPEESLVVDLSAAAREPASERLREWLRGQRVFISSPMADTREHRTLVAAKLRALGTRPIWFEEFGGRDADSEEAYLSEVDASSIYLSILNERYGRRLKSGFSATEAEYLRAREGGKRISIWVRGDAPDRDGHLNRFIEDLHVLHVTGAFEDPPDLAERVEQRLREMAAEALSPWVKLGRFVFRADEIERDAATLVIRARMGVGIQRQIELLAEARKAVRVAYEGWVVEGQVLQVSHRITAGGTSEARITLESVGRVRGDSMRPGTSGLSADDLTELGMKNVLFDEPLPQQLHRMDFLSDPGLDRGALDDAFGLPEEIAQSVISLLVGDGLVGSGRAAAVTHLAVGPRCGDTRRLVLEWEEPTRYSNVTPRHRRVEGLWRQKRA